MAFDDWYESLAKFAEAVPTLGYDIAWQGDFARINNCPRAPVNPPETLFRHGNSDLPFTDGYASNESLAASLSECHA